MMNISLNLPFCLPNQVGNRFRNDWSGSGEDRGLEPLLKAICTRCKTSIQPILTNDVSYESSSSENVPLNYGPKLSGRILTIFRGSKILGTRNRRILTVMNIALYLPFYLLNQVGNRFRNDWSGSGEDRGL